MHKYHERLRLEEFTENDISKLIKWIDSPSLLVQWGGNTFSYPLNEKQFIHHLQETKGENPKRSVFKSILAKSNEIVGIIELDQINLSNGTASICRVFVDKLYRNNGICTEMLSKVLDLAFGHYQLRRLELRVYEANQSAIACYEAIGFVREGLLRKAQKVGNEYWNTVYMSMLKEEWEQ
jgi:RimJ/RimL family protein N-acetyltransferase